MEPIAVVGLSFKLPQGAEDDSSFWDILEKRKNVVTPWPSSRANIDAFHGSTRINDNTVPSNKAHFLSEDPAVFDAPFFSIPSKEASSMDPQQRLLLETAYHALENAGMRLEDVAGTATGVFSGSMESDYPRAIAKDPDEAPLHTATGTAGSMLADRLSWYFDLKGPSIQMNTACSSSMMALDLACQSLRSRQSSMALVTGSNLILSPELSLYLAKMDFLSPDGVCYSFDHRANGYGRGEGIIVLVLKPLSVAISNRDSIRAVIRGTRSGQDGRTASITQPNARSQETLIRQIYSSCKLGFESTHYVEAHGTGTQMGDSTEMRAIGAVFRRHRSPSSPLYVGSVKSNLGHLEGSSGLAAILKCAMILERGVIPPVALFEKLNPKINARRDHIQIPTSCVPWPCSGLRRASVNSFGVGGSNIHVIMDDVYHTLESLSLENSIGSAVLAPPVTNGWPASKTTNGETELNGATPTATAPVSGASPITGLERQLLVYSARDEAGLKRVLGQYSKYYDERILGSPRKLYKLAYTLGSRRSMMPWRSFAVGHAEMSSKAIGLSDSGCVRSSPEAHLCYVFTGQGAQYAKMGLELMQYPAFASTLYKVDEVFQAVGADWALLERLESGDKINLPELSQPICTALQIALLELLRSFHVAPVAVIGHSSGEIAAAYAAGALSLESACRVAYHRGRLCGKLASSSQPSAMMSVNLKEADFQANVERAFSNVPDVHIACVNSPSNITVAGSEPDIDLFKARLDMDGVFAQKLETGLAYHTVMMQEIGSEYLDSLGRLTDSGHDSRMALMVSSVTGQPVPPATLSSAQYWVDNMTSPVRFADALQYLTQAAPKLDGIKAITHYVEIGPHGALRRPLLETLGEPSTGKAPRYTSLLSRLESPLKTIMEASGRLFARGYPISIEAVNQYTVDPGRSETLADTPQYPFDHSQRFWYDSRLSRDWRLRGTAPRSVLGLRSSDWNPLEPRWRKMLSTKDAPWIADHVVDGTILFPASGMVVMALEAVKQSVPEHQKLEGFLLKKATFASPIFIDPEKKVEVVTQLRTMQHDYEKTSLRFEVTVLSVGDDGKWNECLKAVIHAKTMQDTVTEVDGGFEARTAQQSLLQSYQDAKRSCTRALSKEDFYDGLREQGTMYGGAFALADHLFWDGHDVCTARVDVSQAREPYEGVVHPAILDSCFQVCFIPPSQGMTKEFPTFIPHRLRDAWISATGWQYPQTSSLRTTAEARINASSTGINCSFTAFADDGSLLCHTKHSFSSAVATNKGSKGHNPSRLLHSIDWKPQLSLLTKTQLLDYCNANTFLEDEAAVAEYCVRFEDTLRLYLARMLPQLREAIGPKTPAHILRYLTWLERRLGENPGRARGDMSDEKLGEELDALQASKPSWRIFLDVARALPSIIRGETDALEFLHSTDAARDLYGEVFHRTCNEKLFSYLQLAAHETPDQRILEVGAGMGDMTDQVLCMLRQVEEQTGGKAAAFREYIYTDISTAYLDEARTRFAALGPRMTFQALDPERDLAKQGMEPGSCDVILAGNALHATVNLGRTLRNLRRALKPGGQLIFLETTAPDYFVGSFGFGVLPGWWCGEEKSRAWCPTATEAEWEGLLRDNGFSGNDLVIRDYKDERAHHASIIVSSAVEQASQPVEAETQSGRVLLVVGEDDANQRQVASSLAAGALQLYRPMVLTLSQISSTAVTPDDRVVFLADVGDSILVVPSDETFRHIKGWVQQSAQLLWVTATTVADGSYPYSGIKDGFLRVMRSETDGKTIVSLSTEDYSPSSRFSSELAHQIAQVFHSAFEAKRSDLEYVVRGGRIMTGRLICQDSLNKDLLSSIRPQMRQGAWLPGPPLKLDIGARGSLDTIRFIEDEAAYAPLGPTEVEIDSQAWALGFRDVFAALGRLDENEFGTDCAGIVRRVGPRCTKLRVGDRVCSSTFGCMRTYVRDDEANIRRIPATLSAEEACGVLNPGMTAWYSLVEVGRLQRGEKILIHAAAGATGQVAVQIAQMLGAEVLATVGSEAKQQVLMNDYGIPASHIFYSRDLSFAEGVMRVTGGYGVDMVLNSLTGEGLRASWECVAPYGRFIEIGKADIHANAPLPMISFANNVTFSAVDLRHLSFNKLDVARMLFGKTMSLVEEGAIHCPRPSHTFSVSKTEEAFRFLQRGKNTGRVIIRVDHDAQVQKHLIKHRDGQFDADATYLVAAGLGGVGRSILRWMASKGAKQLLVPSRSGAVSEEAQKLVGELTEKGVTIATPRCDVSVASSLQGVLAECWQTMGPIRGCINASMVLQDSIFENMTATQWRTTIRSKVQTSWNLHTFLPAADLDFFVLLSSVSGVLGKAGQSNYAAGCTFQDALARFRASHSGRSAVSIDLGPMRTVGAVAENKELMKSLRKYQGYDMIEEEQLLALLGMICGPIAQDYRTSPFTASLSQISLGLVTPDELLADGSGDMPFKHMYRTLYAYFSQAGVGSSPSAASGTTTNFAALFRQAGTEDERTGVVVESLAQKLARGLSVKLEDVDVSRPLHLYGVDSLVALELRNWISKEFAADVPVFELMSGRTVLAIGQMVSKVSQVKLAASQN